MPDLPFVSVIIVNYNGFGYLPACLDALRDQSYPADCFEVIVSDNGSTDGSRELLQSMYRWVRLLANGRNLGFASGNNVAIQATGGKYVVLLNNDTAPSPHWLENLVTVAESNPHAGLVTGRLRLFYEQLVVALQSESSIQQHDARRLGVQVFGVESGAPGGVVQYLKGFYGWERLATGSRFRWMKEAALLGVPVPPGTGEWILRLSLAASRPDGRRVSVTVSAPNTPLAEWGVTGSAPSEYRLTMPASTRSLARPLVQSAGSLIFRNGSGRDRGAFVSQSEGFYETDHGQYDNTEAVFAGCGASLLIRKDLIADVGMLDDRFFMYYEDTDLAWRARLRGWQVLYAGQATVRHIHCGTSGKWSPFFVYHVERNRLAMLFKNGTPGQVSKAWIVYAAFVAKNTLEGMLGALARRGDWRLRLHLLAVRYRVLGTLIAWLPYLWRKRRSIQKSRRVSPADLNHWFLDEQANP
jgi:GT2 family glycosyltransferase